MDTYNVMLTEEEYNAVMEAREEVYNESIQKDVKKTLNKAGKVVNHTAKDIGKGVKKALGIKSHHSGKKSSDKGEFVQKYAELPGEAYRKYAGNDAKYPYKVKSESFDIVKEAVLDWYKENGYEVNDYEMGRIDSFVENYIEENNMD